MPAIGAPLEFTTVNGVPILKHAYFTTAAARLGAGQKRHQSWTYYQEGLGFLQLLPLAECFLSDGTTPAVNNGSWGTLNAHWRAFITKNLGAPDASAPRFDNYSAPVAGTQVVPVLNATVVWSVGLRGTGAAPDPDRLDPLFFGSGWTFTNGQLQVTSSLVQVGSIIQVVHNGTGMDGVAPPVQPSLEPIVFQLDGSQPVAGETAYLAGYDYALPMTSKAVPAFTSGTGTMQISYNYVDTNPTAATWTTIPGAGVTIADSTFFTLRVLHADGAAFVATLTCTAQ